MTTQRKAMNRNTCRGCPQHKNCRESFSSWFFFIIGLIATIAMRVVTVLLHMDPIYGKIAWYIGVGGFTVFFVYKFRVNQARYISIYKTALFDKINNHENLTASDYDLISAILCSLVSRKERINYFFIFGLSGIALFIALYIDFVK